MSSAAAISPALAIPSEFGVPVYASGKPAERARKTQQNQGEEPNLAAAGAAALVHPALSVTLVVVVDGDRGDGRVPDQGAVRCVCDAYVEGLLGSLCVVIDGRYGHWLDRRVAVHPFERDGLESIVAVCDRRTGRCGHARRDRTGRVGVSDEAERDRSLRLVYGEICGIDPHYRSEEAGVDGCDRRTEAATLHIRQLDFERPIVLRVAVNVAEQLYYDLFVLGTLVGPRQPSARGHVILS